MSGRPSIAGTTPFKLAVLDLLLEDLDIVDNPDRRSIFGRGLELGIGQGCECQFGEGFARVLIESTSSFELVLEERTFRFAMTLSYAMMTISLEGGVVYWDLTQVHTKPSRSCFRILVGTCWRPTDKTFGDLFLVLVLSLLQDIIPT